MITSLALCMFLYRTCKLNERVLRSKTASRNYGIIMIVCIAATTLLLYCIELRCLCIELSRFSYAFSFVRPTRQSKRPPSTNDTGRSLITDSVRSSDPFVSVHMSLGIPPSSHPSTFMHFLASNRHRTQGRIK